MLLNAEKDAQANGMWRKCGDGASPPDGIKWNIPFFPPLALSYTTPAVSLLYYFAFLLFRLNEIRNIKGK